MVAGNKLGERIQEHFEFWRLLFADSLPAAHFET
jgi:hypothetical protein